VSRSQFRHREEADHQEEGHHPPIPSVSAPSRRGCRHHHREAEADRRLEEAVSPGPTHRSYPAPAAQEAEAADHRAEEAEEAEEQVRRDPVLSLL
jgi:hypothetical protein